MTIYFDQDDTCFIPNKNAVNDQMNTSTIVGGLIMTLLSVIWMWVS